jgi:hypothetical protein
MQLSDIPNFFTTALYDVKKHTTHVCIITSLASESLEALHST